MSSLAMESDVLYLQATVWVFIYATLMKSGLISEVAALQCNYCTFIHWKPRHNKIEIKNYWPKGDALPCRVAKCCGIPFGAWCFAHFGLNSVYFYQLLWKRAIFFRITNMFLCYSPGAPHPYSSSLRHATFFNAESSVAARDALG